MFFIIKYYLRIKKYYFINLNKKNLIQINKNQINYKYN